MSGLFFVSQLKKNPHLINQLAELDFIAQRYSLDPVSLIYPNCENPFYRLALLRKIAEAGVEMEKRAYQEAEAKAKAQSQQQQFMR